jgi:uracil-DNA glycosylase family 4
MVVMLIDIPACESLQRQIVACTRCPRLTAYCAGIALAKKRAFRDWRYWGKPVPSFGDPQARVLVLGLAPAAHGANRTGRMFTGDRSAEFLFRALYATGFASQPTSCSRDDGLTLRDAYITAVVHCAPPGNRPALEEILNCREYLERELDLLSGVRVVVALGRLAFDQYLGILRARGRIARKSAFVFAHNSLHVIVPGRLWLIGSYHPSQQNTSTGRLTDRMLLAVFERARALLP